MTTQSPAADLAHLCDHPADTFGTQGCPLWPSCLSPSGPVDPSAIDVPPTLVRAVFTPPRPRGYRGAHRRG